ncbi:hypothetical protein OLZ32_37825 [Rhizobium sp. 1AS11]|uniref:hypothetical protein n=1 Tax=Rhizobium acaciae TaxID=2989736 RepID=UPI002223BE37|nr:hypothetical protein [Rhizobium acaciae]MCW1413746.1 hypothetical protein [Rhizobium acaciae]MCW1746112.1 hypothetical protein [Rhizobium acaciae]
MKNSISNSFAELQSCYDQLMSLCDVLQAIADFLPCHVEEGLCGRISSGLMSLLLTTHQLEEDLISSGLGLIMNAGEQAEAEERRRAGRLFDRAAAQVVVVILQALGEGRCRLSRETVGYQLRSFFCSMRRRITSEREIMSLIERAMEREQASRLPEEVSRMEKA